MSRSLPGTASVTASSSRMTIHSAKKRMVQSLCRFGIQEPAAATKVAARRGRTLRAMPLKAMPLSALALLGLEAVMPNTSRAQSPAPTVTATQRPNVEQFVPRMLTNAQVVQDATVLRQALEQVHAGYDRYTPRRVLDTAFARLNVRAAQPMTDVELYHDIALLLAQIRCNHTKAEYPDALQKYRNTHDTHLPMRVRVFGKRMFVAASASPLLARGSEIVSINGVNTTDIITKLSRYAAVDGFTDFARATLLERDADLMGSDLDHYWPVEFGFPTQWTIGIKDVSGVSRDITLAPISYAIWQRLTGDTVTVDFANGTRVTRLDDTTSLLTVRSFVNYRTPVNADSLFRGIFTALNAANVRHLIIDLRENGGGSDDASNALLRYLIDKPVQPLLSIRRRTINVDSTLRRSFSTWSDPTEIFAPSPALFVRRFDGWYAERGADAIVTPASAAYRGHVSVLVGRRDGSATTMLLAVLQQAGARSGRLRLVGEETGGSAEGVTAGQVLFLALPNSGIRVRIPLKRSDVNVARAVPGLGVFPDVDATETVADFQHNIDRALVAARTVGRNGSSSPLAPTTGLLRGVLEYKDYGSGRRVELPTWMHTAPISDDADGRTLSYRQRTIYDDGPGKTIYSPDELRIAGNLWIEGDPVASPDTLRIVSRQRLGANTRIVLRGRGTDDNKPVEFRYTVMLGANTFSRLKEYRFTDTAPWQYRHEYRFRRNAVP